MLQTKGFGFTWSVCMRNRIVKTVALAALAMLAAGTAEAQGRGNGRRDRDDDRRYVWTRDRDRDYDRDYDRGYRRVPPGLAKKPGHMPPGQFKKRYNRYSTYQGASVLSDILRRRGYEVTRISPYGQSQYVYYRPYRGSERRAIVYPGNERLGFNNVPATLLQAVLAQLY
jgi:Ni/Co efflux regulator RcnB